MYPLISIIIAAYKIEDYLGMCIESIQNQTYKNLEIIVVNDGSPDHCHEIAANYAKNDNRIKIVDKKNGGLSDARNAGIDIAKGEYIAVIDGDDYIEPDMIQIMYDKLSKEHAELCICNIQVVNEEYKPIEQMASSQIKDEVLSQDDMYEKIVQSPNWFYVVAWNKLYKKEIFDKVRYRKGKIHEDELAIHHMVACCKKIVTVEKRLYNYVQRNNSITHNGYKIQQLDIVEAFADRAEFFLEHNQNERAFRMLVRMRTFLLDGCIALKHNKDENVKIRINELYKKYCDIYHSIDFEKIHSDKKSQMKRMAKSLKLAIYTSGNYWNNLKLKLMKS